MTRSDDDALASSAVVVVAKPAVPGRAKTRLSDALGEDAATDLYEAFLADIARRVDDLSLSSGDDVTGVLAYASDPDHDSFAPFANRNFTTMPQGDGDLGERLSRVVSRCFDRGVERLVVVGSDSPTLLERHLIQAFEQLHGHDVVMGPSFDGGYYLLGLGTPATELFDDVDWSTERVFGQTLRRARTNGLLCDLIEFWYDVDTFEDLRRLQSHLLEYLARRRQRVAPETTRALRRLGESGPLSDWNDHPED